MTWSPPDYDVSQDMPGGKVNPDTLDTEIRDSSIATELTEVRTIGGTSQAGGVVAGGSLRLVFAAEPPAAEKTTLDGDTRNPAGGILAAHDTAQRTGDFVLLSLSGDQGIPDTTPTQIAFDTIDKDGGLLADLVNNRAKIKRAGLYLAVGKTRWATNSTSYRELRLRAAGSTVAKDVRRGVAGANSEQSVADVVDLAKGDLVFLTVLQKTGGNLNVLANGCRTTLRLVRLGSS